MSYFGETIRKAREAKGMTTSQIAEKTHILVQIINAMEREDFSQIKAAIYGRGFVKLICECLDLDPKPLVAEFMDIYTGRRPPVVSDFFQPKQPPPAPEPAKPAPAPAAEPVSPPEEPAPAVVEPQPVQEPVSPIPPVEPVPVVEPTPVAEPVPQPEPAIFSAVESSQTSGIVEAAMPNEEPAAPVVPETVKGLDLFDPQPQAKEAPPVTRAQDIFSSVYANHEHDTPSSFSAAEKFRTGLSVVSHGVLGSVRSIPRSAWRIAVLVAGALIVIGLIIWGCVVLYRVTEQPLVTSDDPQPTQPSATPAAKPVSKDATPSPAAAQAKQQVKPTPAAAKQQAKSAPDKTKQQAKPVTPKQNAQPQKKQSAPATKTKLRSTGQKIPPLYVD